MPVNPTLNAFVRGAYDLQMIRIQTGLRLCANFRSKLKQHGQDAKEESDQTEVNEKDELSAEAESVIEQLKASHRRLTDGIAKNRTLPKRQGFIGDQLISEYSELVLIDQYLAIERDETRQFRLMEGELEGIPIYDTYLKHVRGIGPAMAAVLLTRFDIHRARHISSFWRIAGLDVGPDGTGRSRRQEHLIDREYVSKTGETKTKKSITYDPWLKSKLMGVVAGSFLRSGSPWRKVYDDYKHRLLTDPNRIKVTIVEWKRKHAAGEDMKKYWSPKRVHVASSRYMVKMFLADFWVKWRTLEGLPVTEPYSVAKLGMPPHGGIAA